MRVFSLIILTILYSGCRTDFDDVIIKDKIYSRFNNLYTGKIKSAKDIDGFETEVFVTKGRVDSIKDYNGGALLSMKELKKINSNISFVLNPTEARLKGQYLIRETAYLTPEGTQHGIFCALIAVEHFSDIKTVKLDTLAIKNYYKKEALKYKIAYVWISDNIFPQHVGGDFEVSQIVLE